MDIIFTALTVYTFQNSLVGGGMAMNLFNIFSRKIIFNNNKIVFI